MKAIKAIRPLHINLGVPLARRIIWDIIWPTYNFDILVRLMRRRGEIWLIRRRVETWWWIRRRVETWWLIRSGDETWWLIRRRAVTWLIQRRGEIWLIWRRKQTWWIRRSGGSCSCRRGRFFAVVYGIYIHGFNSENSSIGFVTFGECSFFGFDHLSVNDLETIISKNYLA